VSAETRSDGGRFWKIFALSVVGVIVLIVVLVYLASQTLE
jgi:FtsH-binding integral membrane protein